MSSVIGPLPPDKSGEVVQNPGSPQAGKEIVDRMSTVASIGDLKKKAPKFWSLMLKGAAYKIIRQMEKSNQRIKKMNREDRYRR